MVLGSVLNPLNTSLLAVALVPIGLAFGAPPSDTAWLVSALYLACAVGQPVVGRMVDTYGPRRLYLIGTALVGAAGLLGTFAPTLGWLVVARVLIGLGTCAGYPASMALIKREGRRTGGPSPAGVLATLSFANQVIAVVGPSLGGLLVDLGGWRTVFSVNVPFAVACLVLGALFLPRDDAANDAANDAADDAADHTAAHTPDAARGPRRTWDAAGVALFAVSLTALMLFLMDPAARALWLVAITLVAGAGFVWRELRTTDPFLDVRVLGQNRPLLLTYVRQMLTGIVMYCVVYGMPQWLEHARGLSPSHTGLVVLPMFGTAMLFTVLTGRSPAILGKLLAGSAVQVVACAALLLLDGGTSVLWLCVVIALHGIPQALNGLANQNALYEQATPEQIGAASGLFRTFMYVGALCATAATAAAYRQEPDTAGMHALALFAGACAAVLLMTVLGELLLRHRRHRRHRPSRRPDGTR
ncbi:MFS transporter [Promicromonospora sp. NPDC019610]|uniref:MFS transporter n=1 Tax=Promicromonospora sp. NPDC019610 TaxID=3364405 RepID=UPI00378EF671